MELGVDQARAARLDPDAGAGQFPGQRLGGRDLEGLGAGVHRAVRQRLRGQRAAERQQRRQV